MPHSTTDTVPAKDFAAMSIDTLIGNILSLYHEKHRGELPVLIELARKVERVHHDVPEAPLGLARTLERIADDLEAHMQKEELILFPAMRQGMSGIAQPIAVMRHQHEGHAADIAEVERLTHGFAVPDGACGSWRRLYAGAEELCADLREHMRIENEILFPRFEIASKPGCICSHG